MSKIRKLYLEEFICALAFLISILLNILILSDFLENNNKENIISLIINYLIIIESIAICITIISFFIFTPKTTKIVSIVLLTLTTFIILCSIFILADKVVAIFGHQNRSDSGFKIFIEAIMIWWANIFVFAIWYWFIDNGGWKCQNAGNSVQPHFWFTSQALEVSNDNTKKMSDIVWKPKFFDYFFLAFTTSTAFSPTDTQVISRRSKFLVMIQSVISLIILVILFARAINMLDSHTESPECKTRGLCRSGGVIDATTYLWTLAEIGANLI